MGKPIEELLRAAGIAHSSGRLDEASGLAKQVLAEDSRNAQALLLLGVLAGKVGKVEEALSYLDQVVEIDPSSFEAAFWQSMLHRKAGRLDVSLACASRAVGLRPEDAFANNNLGLVLVDLGRYEQAVDAFKIAARARPDMATVQHNLGTALFQVGRDAEAAVAFLAAIKLAPHSVDSFVSLGQVYLSRSQPERALEAVQAALKLQPKSSSAHLVVANALVEMGMSDAAETHLRSALKISPDDPKVHSVLGMRYQSKGDFESANRHILKSLDLMPSQGFGYFAYAHNNRVAEKDRALVQQMEALARLGELSPREQSYLHYALGRAYESLGEYESAMGALDAANSTAKKLKFGGQLFDRGAFSRAYDRLINLYSEDSVQSMQGKGNSSSRPIFIVGMMRSGTTLVEQILSCHSSIAVGGEQMFWPRRWDAILSGQKEQLLSMGSEHLKSLESLDSEKPFVTDKMPSNFELLGPIHVALPNAKFIHVKRNPVDTAISIYATPNRIPVEYAHDRGNIVFAYREYLRLVRHWKQVIPTDQFVEIQYEDLIADREPQIRRLLAFLGLEWEESVMHHEASQRSVLTPSLWQVRQPIYGTSVERWRRYEPWLREFSELQ